MTRFLCEGTAKTEEVAHVILTFGSRNREFISDFLSHLRAQNQQNNSRNEQKNKEHFTDVHQRREND